MVIRKIFGVYDIRGKYPGEINEEVFLEIGSALARSLKNKKAPGKIIVGYDARLSSKALYKSVKKAFKKGSLRLIGVGLATTPMIYFLVNRLGARLGVMITASHNPQNYNGLKVIGVHGRRVGGREILKIMRNGRL